MRGFNLLYFFNDRHPVDTDEADFRRIAEWGFNFVRLPMSYYYWADPAAPNAIDERFWEKIDGILGWADKYNLHLCLNFHRAPGYCVASEPAEPFDLWHDAVALECFLTHWRYVAGRYKSISPERLSLNLVNEPPATFRPGEAAVADGMSEHVAVAHERLVHVYRSAIDAIREVDPARPVVIDGTCVGNDPVPEINIPGVTQSCRGYQPFGLSHYKATWPAYKPTRLPTWPFLERDGRHWDASTLAEAFAPWSDLQAQGVAVHCGEWGVFCHTPHAVALAWMESFLALLKERHVGWSLWNLNGPFGIIDSERTDITYEDLDGKSLDRAMLALLQRY